MSTMIETDGLGRYFGDIKAVDGISFKVSSGEVLGFLGPNGAGKSTTMKMLTCFLPPSFGSAKVGGFDVVEQSREVRKIIGYLPENAPIYGEMEVRQFLDFVAEVREIEQRTRKAAVDRVLALTSLEGVVNQRIETLSKGFKRRVGLAQALIHDPAILILDEPTEGLDPNQKHEVRQLISKMSKDKCILLSTHILEEVDEVCSRAVIIAKGRILADDLPDNLRKQSKHAGAVSFSLQRGPDSAAVKQVIAGIPGVAEVAEDTSAGTKIAFTVYPNAGEPIAAKLLGALQSRDWQLVDLRVESGRLDEVFRQITA
jgi:ABC-2 type transport system ATP-binding protein